MKKFVFVTFLCITGVLPIYAQEQQKNPDEQIFVNKKFDENGNLIQYDSTYVHQWSSDSAFNFSYSRSFPNMTDHLAIDSFLRQFGKSHHFGFSPFEDEDFFGQFEQMSPDSIFMDHFALRNDSSFRYHFDPQLQLNHFFDTPGIDQWQNQLQQQLEQLNDFMPKFQNDEQRKEWETLRKKQQKEMQDLLNRWGKQ